MSKARIITLRAIAQINGYTAGITIGDVLVTGTAVEVAIAEGFAVFVKAGVGFNVDVIVGVAVTSAGPGVAVIGNAVASGVGVIGTMIISPDPGGVYCNCTFSVVPGWNTIVPESFPLIRNKIVSPSLALIGGVRKILLEDVRPWIGKVNRLLLL